ncbi:uncharacterized protein CPUR_08872 [Claviceps purpurea 20.1]|uniref:Uncharacterized protein n=1 Tax=Claviceps purpurea (strain 20.1) TaxID=1111077 RepID=M1WGY2_CLAP2|nr:uncharacterized protein CPUR_08872 [Claviceps purpurea 20.1]
MECLQGGTCVDGGGETPMMMVITRYRRETMV